MCATFELYGNPLELCLDPCLWCFLTWQLRLVPGEVSLHTSPCPGGYFRESEFDLPKQPSPGHEKHTDRTGMDSSFLPSLSCFLPSLLYIRGIQTLKSNFRKCMVKFHVMAWHEGSHLFDATFHMGLYYSLKPLILKHSWSRVERSESNIPCQWPQSGHLFSRVSAHCFSLPRIPHTIHSWIPHLFLFIFS